MRPAAGSERAGGDIVVLMSANMPASGSPQQPQPTADTDGATPSELATVAYARLAAGDRRGAARLFDEALAGGDDPRSAAWRAQRDALTRGWSGSAYSIVRSGGSSSIAVAPVLGGGQSGAALAWTPDPLAVRPLALTLRETIAHDDRGRSALAAAGIAWHPFTGVTLAAERLLPVGPAARGDWALRVAGGLSRSVGALDASAYGEAGAVGSVVYAAAQARLGASIHRRNIALGTEVGSWASVQHGHSSTTGSTSDPASRLAPGGSACQPTTASTSRGTPPPARGRW
ncbi:hypothetical protein KZX46_09180 [Polymorphobacter sp. PAMC 29334]|uniref:hypothetical protein n=1 Tax=Polymorphobacter sp. PAMC 29334 TaxID=2862331 RepID=UPI001C77E04D|nr:hypothetical protein [Polymorphobacter sp. PAMC 29334]QYE36082.1 hypothetical protein KZX46_09180 [Polymorphobacter sp. PAMC 29334]